MFELFGIFALVATAVVVVGGLLLLGWLLKLVLGIVLLPIKLVLLVVKLVIGFVAVILVIVLAPVLLGVGALVLIPVVLIACLVGFGSLLAAIF